MQIAFSTLSRELLSFVNPDRISSLDLSMLSPCSVHCGSFVLSLLQSQDALQFLDCSLLVLYLASFFSAGNNDACGLVADAYTCLHLVDMLAALAARSA